MIVFDELKWPPGGCLKVDRAYTERVEANKQTSKQAKEGDSKLMEIGSRETTNTQHPSIYTQRTTLGLPIPFSRSSTCR
jgi:hypothetical protein